MKGKDVHQCPWVGWSEHEKQGGVNMRNEAWVDLNETYSFHASFLAHICFHNLEILTGTVMRLYAWMLVSVFLHRSGIQQRFQRANIHTAANSCNISSSPPTHFGGCLKFTERRQFYLWRSSIPMLPTDCKVQDKVGGKLDWRQRGEGDRTNLWESKKIC